MPYTTLLVQVEEPGLADGRVRIAVALARKFDAALIGIAALPELAPFGTDEELRGIRSRLSNMEEHFRQLASPIQTTEWRSAVEFPVEMIVRESRAADLIIIGKGGRRGAADPGETILKAGRPVLVVPDGIDRLNAQSIVVAWKDTREVRRALRDAIPFLKEAKEVAIVAVNEEGLQASIQKEQLDDVMNYLIRQRVLVRHKVILHKKTTVTDELLRFANVEGADLIVAGAYGHSRLGEWIFGGVTRHLLSNSHISCLFSH